MPLSCPAPLVHVVDDDPSVRRSLGRLLRSLGLRAGSFASGPELLSAAPRDEAECFVVDVHMPGMSGYELAQQLAEARPDSPVILISAHMEEANRWMREAPKAVAFLLKPFSERELVTALDRALGQELFSDR